MNGAPQDAGPDRVSFAELSRAVEVLTGAVKSGPRHMTAEEAAELRAIMVEAVRSVQITARALHRFLICQAEARALLMRGNDSDREPDQLEAVGHAVEGCLTLVETFGDTRQTRADAPLFRLLQELRDVQRGRRSDLFEPVTLGGRSTSSAGAALKGLAVCAVDARERAGETVSNAGAAVAARFVGVPLTHGTDPRRSTITAETVKQWRKDARKGLLSPDEAQQQWRTYEAGSGRLDCDAAGWRAIAAQLERTITEQIATLPRSFTLSGSAQRDAQDKLTGTRRTTAASKQPRARG